MAKCTYKDILLLDEAINVYAKGNQTLFAEFTHIKESTIKTWRNRGAIPNDKKLLLEVLVEKHKLIEENKKFKQFFALQNELLQKTQI